MLRLDLYQTFIAAFYATIRMSQHAFVSSPASHERNKPIVREIWAFT